MGCSGPSSHWRRPLDTTCRFPGERPYSPCSRSGVDGSMRSSPAPQAEVYVVKCVVLQPSYIPWRGYFHQIQKADTFVFYDDVQFDKRGWRHRNRIKTPQGPTWLTIPVLSRNHQVENTPINQIEIYWDSQWSRKHWLTL